MKKNIQFLILLILIIIKANAQRQNNTLGSEVFVDVPHYIFNKYSPLPVSVYIHESECNNCNNYLNYIDIRFKSASDTQWSPVYVFSNWNYTQYLSLFSDYSIEDTLWGSQSFIESCPYNSSNHTILFTADTNFWIPPVPVVNVNKRYFYFNFNVPNSLWNMFLCEDSVIDIHVYVSLDYAIDEEFFFRVFVAHNGLPSVNNWYRGDTHFHSYYTQNVVENGFPLPLSKTAAKCNGLSWITVTDHSCDFDNYGVSPYHNYQRLKTEIQQLNNGDNEFKLIPAIEASILNNGGKTIHALVYPPESLIFSLPYFLDAKGDYELTSINIQMLYDSLKKYNAFCFAAHPFAEGDKLPDIINGGVWNVSDINFKLNGTPHSYAGTVICNDINSSSDVFSDSDTIALFYPLYGFQIWNLWYTLTCTDTYLDPWNTNYNNEPFGFTEVISNDYLHHFYKLQQNLEVYNFILQKTIRRKNINPALKHWQAYIIGGSDAHGSFNFSTTDYVNMGISGYVENNFAGSINTLVYCPEGMGNNGENILKSLKDGKAILSSGPVIVPKIYYNSNNYYCGDTIEISMSNYNSARIYLTAKTSRIFGEIFNCKIFIITENEVITRNLNLSGQTSIFYLNHLLDTIINSNVGKYMSVYFILTTKADYSKPYIYKKDFEYYYSITNPIWIRVKNNLLIDDYCSDNFSYIYNPIDKTLIFNNLLSVVEIFDVTGKTLLKENNTKFVNCNTLKSGIYFIKLIKNNNMNVSKFLNY